MADLPIASDQGAAEVEIVQSATQNRLAISANGALPPHSDVVGTGTIAALNGNVAVLTNGCGSVTFNITGTWVATLSFQATTDGTNWFAVYGTIAGTDSTTELIATNNPVTISCGGFAQVRLIATAYTSGTANIAWDAGTSINQSLVFSPVASSFNATIQAVPATLGVTATAASGTAVTLTLPAVAGQFHYITHIDIVAYTSLARVGVAAPILVTSTNLSGNPVWDFATVGAIGTTDRLDFDFTIPVKSSTVNTATTVVCPAATSVLWRLTAFYYAAI